MNAICPECHVSMFLDGHGPGKVVRCSCEALLYVTTTNTLECVPPDRALPLRPMTLWSQSEQIRERLLAEIDRLQTYQLQALAGQFRRLGEACLRELARREESTP